MHKDMKVKLENKKFNETQMARVKKLKPLVTEAENLALSSEKLYLSYLKEKKTRISTKTRKKQLEKKVIKFDKNSTKKEPNYRKRKEGKIGVLRPSLGHSKRNSLQKVRNRIKLKKTTKSPVSEKKVLKKKKITKKTTKVNPKLTKTLKKKYLKKRKYLRKTFKIKPLQIASNLTKFDTILKKKKQKKIPSEEEIYQRLEEDRQLFEAKMNRDAFIPGTRYKFMRFYQPEDIEEMKKKIKKENLRKIK